MRQIYLVQYGKDKVGKDERKNNSTKMMMTTERKKKRLQKRVAKDMSGTDRVRMDAID